MAKLIPSSKNALVELIDKYEGIATLEGKYNLRINGLCLSVGDKTYDHYLGKKLYWDEFKAGDVIEMDGKKYCFTLLEDIKGYLDETD